MSASSFMVFKSDLLNTSVDIGIFPVTTRLLGRFDCSTVNTSALQIISMSCVLFFVTVKVTC